MRRWVAELTARSVLAAVGARVSVEVDGRVEQEVTRERLDEVLPRQAVFYANHSSHLDFVTLWSLLPGRLQQQVRPVAAADYWGRGLRRVVAERVFNAYLVDRGTRTGRGARTTLRTGTSTGASPGDAGQVAGMLEVLRGGQSLIIFPEGTRGSGERVARFKGGLHVLATECPDVPVVPVSLVDLGRILPKGEAVPVPHLSTIRFHAPLDPPGQLPRREYLARAREVVERAVRGDLGEES